MYRLYLLLTIFLFSFYILKSQDVADFNYEYDTVNIVKYNLDEAVIYSFREGVEVKKMPASTAVLSLQQIERNNFESLKDLSSFVSNFFMPNYGSQLTSPVFIRGIGSRINSPSVGLYVDHIPYFDKSSFDFDFYDIQYIEVLRGPQGTLYGRNTMGGIVNVFSLSPSNYKGTRFFLSGGNYDYAKAVLSHYGTLSEKSYFSLAANYQHKGGYFTNLYDNNKSGKVNIGSGKLRFVHEFSNSFNAEVFVQYEHSRQNGYPYALIDKNDINNSSINYNEPSSYERDFITAGLLTQWTTSKFILRWSTGYSYLNDKQLVDQDFTPEDICLATQKQKQNMLSNELIIRSNTNNKYQWLFGMFEFWQHNNLNVFLDFGEDAVKKRMVPALMTNEMDYKNPTFGWAVFHQSKLNNILIKGMSLEAGVRIHSEYANSDYKQIITLKKANNKNITQFDMPLLNYIQALPKFTINYKPNNQLLFYANVAKGYKTGGFNYAVDDIKDATFNSEYTWNYELGYKFNIWDGALTSEGAVFYIDWYDQQIYQFNPSGIGSILKNAGRSKSKGFELFLKVIPIKNLSITGSYGYTNAYFTNYKNVNSKTGVTIDYKNNLIPYVPTNTLSLNAQYSVYFHKSLINRVDFMLQYLGTGKLYWDEANIHKQPYYSEFNAKISIRKNSFVELGIWMQNIFNVKYQSFYFEALGNSFLQYNKPFLVGVDLKLFFNK